MSGISLGDELAHLADALSAVLRQMQQQGGGDPEVRAQAAMLSLITERVRLVRRVVKGDMPAQLLAAAHNLRGGVAPGEDGDVVLPVSPQPAAHPARRRRPR